MSHRDERDPLDRRLLGYLDDKADLAAASGPGASAIAASIAGGAARSPTPRFALGRVPALAWIVLSLILLLVVILGAGMVGGGSRRPSLAIVPPSTASAAAPTARAASATASASGPAEALQHEWGLDPEASGIDDSYGGSPRPDGLVFVTYATFDANGRFEVVSGAGGGCAVSGTWAADRRSITNDISTEINPCEATGPGPAAREIRRRLARATSYHLSDGQALTRLSLYDDTGALLLVLARGHA